MFSTFRTVQFTFTANGQAFILNSVLYKRDTRVVFDLNGNVVPPCLSSSAFTSLFCIYSVYKKRDDITCVDIIVYSGSSKNLYINYGVAGIQCSLFRYTVKLYICLSTK